MTDADSAVRKRTGNRFEEMIAARFRDYGLEAKATPAIYEFDHLGAAANRERFRDQFDVTVEGRRIEVKSRTLTFTGPADFPYPTALVYSAESWSRKVHKPAAVVLISQKAGGVAVVRVSDERHWIRREVTDRARGHSYTALEVESFRLAEFGDLARWLAKS